MSDTPNEEIAVNESEAMGFDAPQASVALEGENVALPALEVAPYASLTDATNEPQESRSSDVAPIPETSDVVQIQATTSRFTYSNKMGLAASACIALHGALQIFKTISRDGKPMVDTAFLDQIVKEGCQIFVDWHNQQPLGVNDQNATVDDYIYLFPQLVTDGIRKGSLDPFVGITAMLRDCQSPTDWVCIVFSRTSDSSSLLCLPPTEQKVSSRGEDKYEYYFIDSFISLEFGSRQAYCRIHTSLPDLSSTVQKYTCGQAVDEVPDVMEFLLPLFNRFVLYPLRLRKDNDMDVALVPTTDTKNYDI